jgi:hypothetical protein
VVVVVVVVGVASLDQWQQYLASRNEYGLPVLARSLSVARMLSTQKHRSIAKKKKTQKKKGETTNSFDWLAGLKCENGQVRGVR